VAIVALALVVPTTLIGSRLGLGVASWPGYLWLAVMFYLLVSLAVLEIPVLIAKRAVAGRTKPNEQAVASGVAVHGSPVAVATDGDGRGTNDGPATIGRGTNDGPATIGRGTNDGPATMGRGTNDGPATIDGPANPDRRLLLSRAAAIAAGVTAVGLTGSGVRTALSAPRVNRVRIDLAKLPRSMDGLRIATVSDIHLGPLAGRAHAQRVVSVINSVDADLVAMVGDLVDGTVAELGEAAEPLQDIRSRLGAFFVTGNHEYYSGAEEWVAEVERLGLRALRNERVEIEGLDLAGVNDLADPAHAPDFDQTLAGRDASRPVVLLAHQPVLVDRAREHGVDLQLSGHTHGGQIVPFNLVVRLAQPVVSGYARFDDTQLFVTNGAGFWGPPVRVGAPPQVTLVELRAES
jgi:predicted MPP superfamily phosphohydrolase